MVGCLLTVPPFNCTTSLTPSLPNTFSNLLSCCWLFFRRELPILFYRTLPKGIEHQCVRFFIFKDRSSFCLRYLSIFSFSCVSCFFRLGWRRMYSSENLSTKKSGCSLMLNRLSADFYFACSIRFGNYSSNCSSSLLFRYYS